MGNKFLRAEVGLADLIEEDVQLELGLKELKSLETETLERTVSNHSTQQLEISHKLLQSNSLRSNIDFMIIDRLREYSD